MAETQRGRDLDTARKLLGPYRDYVSPSAIADALESARAAAEGAVG